MYHCNRDQIDLNRSKAKIKKKNKPSQDGTVQILNETVLVEVWPLRNVNQTKTIVYHFKASETEIKQNKL